MTKDDHIMKHIAALLAAATLSGCASFSGSEPPHYDYSQQAAIAPGFPVKRVDQPPGYQLAGVETLSYQQGQDGAVSSSGARIDDVAVAWHSPEDRTSVVAVVFREVAAPAYFLPAPSAESRATLGDATVDHVFQKGRYRGVAGTANGLVPDGAPGCAYGTGLIVTASDARHRMIGSLSEGLPCNELNTLTPADRHAQLQRAYRLLGLQK